MANITTSFCPERPSDPETGERQGHYYVLNAKSFGVCRYCGAATQFRGQLTRKEFETLATKAAHGKRRKR